jgi:hypothetical protein
MSCRPNFRQITTSDNSGRAVISNTNHPHKPSKPQSTVVDSQGGSQPAASASGEKRVSISSLRSDIATPSRLAYSDMVRRQTRATIFSATPARVFPVDREIHPRTNRPCLIS